MTTDEVGRRNGMVWVEGKGYVLIAKAYAYQALGRKVHWDTAEPEENINPGLAYKND
jgi:hypothetical protein